LAADYLLPDFPAIHTVFYLEFPQEGSLFALLNKASVFKQYPP
jgi:hypothetical protein